MLSQEETENDRIARFLGELSEGHEVTVRRHDGVSTVKLRRARGDSVIWGEVMVYRDRRLVAALARAWAGESPDERLRGG